MITDDIRNRLTALADRKLADFNARLIPNIDKSVILGIKTPVLRKMAKELVSSGEYRAFIDGLPHLYFEENQLHAFILAEIKNFDDACLEVERFLPYIDNWATCDQLIIRAFSRTPDKLLERIDMWLKSEKPYTVRFSIGLLMRYFLDEHFDTCCLFKVAAVESDEYYVNMMSAWYFATALAKQYDATLPILKDMCLSPWVHNKAIRKACESYRVPDEHKKELRALAIKNLQRK